MIDIATYRARIGRFCPKPRKKLLKNIQEYCSTSHSNTSGKTTYSALKSIMKIIIIFTLLYPTCHATPKCSLSTAAYLRLSDAPCTTALRLSTTTLPTQP